MRLTGFIIIFSFFSFYNLLAQNNIECKKLIDKPLEWSKCVKDKTIQLGKKGSKKLNTDSKLTDWIKKKLEK